MKNKRTIGILAVIIAILVIIIATLFIMLKNKEENAQPIITSNKVAEENTTEEVESKSKIEEVEKEELDTIEKGKIANSKSTYIDEKNEEAVIPVGYAVIKDSPNIEEGLVISDEPDDDLENSKDGNQFVWVPVETPALDVSGCKDETDINDEIVSWVSNGKYPMAVKLANGNYRGVLYKFETINEGTQIKVNSTVYSEKNVEREPENLDDNGDYVENWEQTTYQEEYNKLVETVKKDGGFWIARFETSVNQENKAQSKKDKKVLTNTSWYELYNIEKTLTQNTTTSSMIWGSQWDQVMIWLKDVKNSNGENSKFYILDSTNMGNYLDTEIRDTTNATLKASGEAFRFKSGEIGATMVKNIYDLAGNVWEWTMEASYVSSRDARGGDCTYYGKNYSASARYAFLPNYNGEKLENIGSRMTIY